MFYTEHVVHLRNDVNNNASKNSLNVNDVFLEHIVKNIDVNSKILDIGTGNGFVLKLIKAHSLVPVRLYGIDNSKEMVNASKGLAGIDIRLADNYNIPFADGFFDLVTAKNVTRFSAEELYRVLTPTGKFFLREYGEYKGLVEISKLFPGRLIRSRKVDFYAKLLKDAGFTSIEILHLPITRTFPDVKSVLNVVKSYPYILDYSKEDEERIIRYLEEDPSHLTITSDPFILIGGK